MSDEPDPPRKTYGLKLREFESVNEPRPNAPPATPPARDPGIIPATAGPIDVRELARHATVKGRALSSTAPVNRPNEIHAMLQDNLARADAAGLNELAPQVRRSSRRRRDYWVLMIGVNGLVASSLLIVGVNLVSIFVVLAAIGFFSAAVTWIMWFLLEDY
jgi:hypothetical protein